MRRDKREREDERGFLGKRQERGEENRRRRKIRRKEKDEDEDDDQTVKYIAMFRIN